MVEKRQHGLAEMCQLAAQKTKSKKITSLFSFDLFFDTCHKKLFQTWDYLLYSCLTKDIRFYCWGYFNLKKVI